MRASILKAAMLCKHAYDGTKIGDHSYTVDYDGDRTVIAIAGTANVENVIEDASCWPSRTPTEALAHNGVVHAFEEMEEEVSKHAIKPGPVVFAGHSLGGGIAQLFAEKFKCEVITFGSIKTYWRFSDIPKLQHTMVVCEDDPVPMLLGFMYTNKVIPLVLKKDGDLPVEVEDHFIEEYIKRLEVTT
jgi:hypothetical protein